jgi:hypothetical protein
MTHRQPQLDRGKDSVHAAEFSRGRLTAPGSSDADMTRPGADAVRAHSFDLVGFDRARLLRDALLGLVLIPVSLVFILGGTSAAGWIVYGAPEPPYFLGGPPLPAVIYGVLVWPFIWGLTEQVTYNGYLVPRL